jgi:hypothetical protein
MRSNKKLFNYKLVDCIENYNFLYNHVDIRDFLIILNFNKKFMNYFLIKSVRHVSRIIKINRNITDWHVGPTYRSHASATSASRAGLDLDDTWSQVHRPRIDILKVEGPRWLLLPTWRTACEFSSILNVLILYLSGQIDY